MTAIIITKSIMQNSEYCSANHFKQINAEINCKFNKKVEDTCNTIVDKFANYLLIINLLINWKLLI